MSSLRLLGMCLFPSRRVLWRTRLTSNKQEEEADFFEHCEEDQKNDYEGREVEKKDNGGFINNQHYLKLFGCGVTINCLYIS